MKQRESVPSEGRQFESGREHKRFFCSIYILERLTLASQSLSCQPGVLGVEFVDAFDKWDVPGVFPRKSWPGIVSIAPVR